MRGFYAVIIAALAVVAIGVPASKIQKAPERKPDCPSLGTARLPHPTECSSYYICQDGKSTIYTCPDGLHFNNAIKQCDWPPAGCFPGMTRPETQPNIPDEKEGDGDSPSRCIGTCPLPDPMDRTIHLPYSGDCTKFCKCSNGVPVPMDCPPYMWGKLHWDKSKDVCNWPWEANCSS